MKIEREHKTSRRPHERSPEVSLLFAELDQRGWDLSDLARETGMGLGYLRFLVSANFPVRRPALLVERVLGRPIFSTPGDFFIRSAWHQTFGVDPELVGLAELKQIARRHGISNFSRLKRTLLIKKLTASLQPALRHVTTTSQPTKL
jgi:hypothetical protein